MRRGLSLTVFLLVALCVGAAGATAGGGAGADEGQGSRVAPGPGTFPLHRAAATGVTAGERRWVTRGGARPSVPSLPPDATFAALNDDNSTIPPDTNGTVGPSHLMTMLNSQVRVQSKAGTPVGGSTVDLQSWWDVDTTCFRASNQLCAFDPRLAYDAIDNHWIAAAAYGAGSASSSILIGATSGTDPASANWARFRFDADSGNTLWADFPTLGFNKDWVVVSVNMFKRSNDNFAHTRVFVFDKAALESGSSGTPLLIAGKRYVVVPDAFALQPTETLDPAESAIYLVEDYNGGSGRLELRKVSGPAATPSLSHVATILSSARWSDVPPLLNFLPQKGTKARIDGGDARMGQCQLRTPSGAGSPSIWCAHTVFVPAGRPTRAVVQWWRLGTDGSILERGRIGGTQTSNHYAYPSLAVNDFGDVLFGFSIFSPTRYASAGYAMHLAGDVSGSTRDPRVLQAGEATYTKTFGTGVVRWGDYSHSGVDPSDDRSLWTIQEYARPHAGGFTRWGTWWGKVTPGTVDVKTTVTDSPDPVVARNTLTYNINVSNGGPLAATNVAVTVTLPQDILGFTAPGSCTGTTILTCAVGGLAAGGTQNLPVTVTPASGPRSITLRALGTSDQVDRSPTNDGATAVTTVKAEPGTMYVAVRDSGFSPEVLDAPRGTAVRWSLFGPSNHAVVDGSGMNLFSFGPAAPVTSFGPFTFNSAGVYPVNDGAALTSRIRIPVGVSPASGSPATNFTVRWAAAAPAAGFVFDVQHKGPGGTWQPFRTGVTALTGVWNPNRQTAKGTHGFRARTRDTGTNEMTGWSLVRTVKLHS